MHHTRTTAAAAALAVCGAAALALAAAPAQAASGSVHLYKIYYNSPGTDTRSAASLNAEYVQIKNTTSKSVSLKGWSVTDASAHKYTFTAYTLGAGKTVTIHTGKGTNTTTNRYWGSGNYIWNNDKDTATLKTSTGTRTGTCSYNSTRTSYKMC
ncbi:lamin tail domain-containing protein [Streptomyces sp. NPDC021224]|uniref:lamin tail domain-containing protein n=1 Tax=unclassified Streptomyces TaxID=2593676 RepID=UPI00378BB055